MLSAGQLYGPCRSVSHRQLPVMHAINVQGTLFFSQGTVYANLVMGKHDAKPKHAWAVARALGLSEALLNNNDMQVGAGTWRTRMRTHMNASEMSFSVRTHDKQCRHTVQACTHMYTAQHMHSCTPHVRAGGQRLRQQDAQVVSIARALIAGGSGPWPWRGG